MSSLAISRHSTLLPILLLAACSGSGDSTTATLNAPEFVVVAAEPVGGSPIHLNDELRIAFSEPLDLESVSLNSIVFTAMDSSGNPLSEQVHGRFFFAKGEDGLEDPRVLRFEPALPTTHRYDDGGFRPDRNYLVRLLRGDGAGSPGLRSQTGARLSATSPFRSLRFRTRSGNSAEELFRDTRPHGPRVLNVRVSPGDDGFIAVGELSGPPVEVEIDFDQPLDPSEANVRTRSGHSSDPFTGLDEDRISLQYDDPEYGRDQRIPCALAVVRNDSTGATVVLRPTGMLPCNAEIRVVVARTLRDLAGEDNRSSVGWSTVTSVFRTRPEPNSRIDAVVWNFAEAGLLDPEAAITDPVARLLEGKLVPSFDFEGDIDAPDWRPKSRITILNTVRTQVAPNTGPARTVEGGVFSFGDITIPEGSLVQGQGGNPLVFLAHGDVQIDGHLSVDAGDGGSYFGPWYRDVVVAGGAGACGGGRGGRSSLETTKSTQRGEAGHGWGDRPGAGGEGGRISCDGETWAGGGGGGSMSSAGDDPFYGNSLPQTQGQGAGELGGRAGPLAFEDANENNDFWGRAIDKDGRLVVGELSAPRGGSGGGGGGDKTRQKRNENGDCFAPQFVQDQQGGGGGGGAGIVVVKALGRIRIGPQGRVSADGGGGGWGVSGSCGGSGSGGMVILMSAKGIELSVHGAPHEAPDWDSDFAVTADGGASSARFLYVKYMTAQEWRNTGPGNAGFGGMGVVQLMTPPGSDADDTGTRFDDHIVVQRGQEALRGTEKRAYLLGGDVRPVPQLLPVPFGAFSQARSHWLYTGASVRRAAAAGPRALPSGSTGPEYRFAGLIRSGSAAGYLETDSRTGTWVPRVVPFSDLSERARIVEATASGANVRAQSVHVIELELGLLPEPGALAQHRCLLLDATNVPLGEFRIVDHDHKTLYLDAQDGSLAPEAAKAQILAKFLDVRTDGSEGLGGSYARSTGNRLRHFPLTNIQVGFAFHADPARPLLSTMNNTAVDLRRWPREPGSFLFDLESPTARNALRELHYPFVKLMVRFNRDFDPDAPDQTRGALDPSAPTPAVRFVTLPYRY